MKFFSSFFVKILSIVLFLSMGTHASSYAKDSRVQKRSGFDKQAVETAIKVGGALAVITGLGTALYFRKPLAEKAHSLWSHEKLQPLKNKILSTWNAYSTSPRPVKYGIPLALAAAVIGTGVACGYHTKVAKSIISLYQSVKKYLGFDSKPIKKVCFNDDVQIFTYPVIQEA